MDTVPENGKIILKTKDGPICGYIDRRVEGTYYIFKKIPYAKPPLGCLRFMPPQPIEPWTNTLDCTQDAPLPIGFKLYSEIEGSEDCLYIEVSSPIVKPDKLLPVMFWIGTSCFFLRTDNIYDPTLIIDQNIVFVRCGFRLGSLGFLSINDFSAPGNSGLKDVVMALRWVQDNIGYFGGDCDNVTIFGSGSGGAIVHLMILSPMATGLFNKAIMQSSSALNQFSITNNPIKTVIKLAQQLGITKSDKMEIVEELKTINAFDLMNASKKLWAREVYCENCYIFDSLFKPCIENEFEGQPIFLNKYPAAIIRSGIFNKVPIIIGSNNTEASVLQYTKRDFYTEFNKFNKDNSLIVPKLLSSADSISAKKLSQELIDFYFQGSAKEHDKTQYLQFLSDCYFLHFINRTVRLHSQFASEYPIYYYILNISGRWSVPEELNYFNSNGHYAEIPYLFRIKNKDSAYCDGCRDSVITRKRVIKMWTNFAKYGNPTPYEDDPDLQITWDRVTNKEKLNYLSIGYELTKGRNPFYERMMLWDKLNHEHALLKKILYFNDLGIFH